MRILLAEDDSVLADGLTRSLRQSGYAIDCVKNGQEADTALSTQEFDLLILDLGLPKMSGLEVLRRLRARASLLPVLILTAADSIEQRVNGLDLGADDYMAKPFALSELEARVRALTRRGAGGGATIIKHGPLSYDQVGRSAYINDQMLDLSARELGLLEILLGRTGRLVSKEQLVDHLCEWGEEVSNNAIEVYVHRLRTPLAAIRLQLELAHTSQRPEIRDKAFNNATHAVDRATHVVSQLLLLARLEHCANIEHQPIDFAQIAHDALAEAGKPVDAAHLMIDGTPQLLGQPMLWALVLRNLIDNAHHYAGDAAQVFIQISTRQITVYDTGKGMDAAQKARLGERFYRPAGQTASGAGLGWSIIQRIAQLHHTRIEMFDVQPHGFGVRFDF